MALDLEALRAEIQAYLDKSALAVFHGYHGMPDSLTQVYWDCEQHPDFREFLNTARKAGAKLIVFHHRAFSTDEIDQALDELEECDFTREEKRSYESRLRQLQPYEGFTCSLELSFTLDGRVYLYELRTDWYTALNEIVAELDAASGDTDEEEDSSMGGYFSNN